MKSTNMKTYAFALVLAIVISSLTFAQDKQKTDVPKKAKKQMSCCGNMNAADTEAKSDSGKVNNEIVVNLDDIDKNKDGKVFIDGMCPDVVKDEAGECPNCGMQLKEVSIKKAKLFLQKNCVKLK